MASINDSKLGLKRYFIVLGKEKRSDHNCKVRGYCCNERRGGLSKRNLYRAIWKTKMVCSDRIFIVFSLFFLVEGKIFGKRETRIINNDSEAERPRTENPRIWRSLLRTDTPDTDIGIEHGYP